MEVQVGKSYYLIRRPDLIFTITEIEHWRVWGIWNDPPAKPSYVTQSTMRTDKTGEDWLFLEGIRLIFAPCSKLHRYLYSTEIGQE